MSIRISIEDGDPRPIYVQIVDEIRRAVVVGALKPHDPLPSVRRLATRLGVNPNTVQLAYRELQRHNVVYKRRGLGTFVAPRTHDAAPGEAERQDFAAAIARRAIRDAYRHGVTASQLIDAVRHIEKEE